MDHRRTEQFYAVTAPGLEEVCAAELTALGIAPGEISTGGIAFTAKLRELYLANLWLRTATRILVRFAEFQSRDFPDLYRKALRLPWGSFIKAEKAVAFRITCHGSRLNHTTRIAETLESALNQALGRSTNPAATRTQLVLVRIVDDRVMISIDSSGELLHRRGYRQSTTAAPLRETLAAGILVILGWDGSEALADPMCGSGSFLTEGALLARQQAPGLNRSYAFMDWPGYREGLWKLLCDEANRRAIEPKVSLTGADESPEAITAARDNAERSGNDNYITFTESPLNQHQPRDGSGLVVCNPPYGKRLALDQNAQGFYADLGTELKRIFPGWRKAIICPDPGLVKAAGLPFRQAAKLDNGGLSVGLYVTAARK